MRSIKLSALTAVLALAFSASLAMAQGGPGGFWAGVPKEKQEQVAKLYAEGRQQLYEIESQKWAKQAELNALMAASKPDMAKIDALAKEIGQSTTQAYQARVALHQRILKDTGVDMPLTGGCAGGYGPGGGRGGCGGYGGGRGGCGAGPAAVQGDNLPSCCRRSL
jgi:zinc resistance-associated protein